MNKEGGGDVVVLRTCLHEGVAAFIGYFEEKIRGS